MVPRWDRINAKLQQNHPNEKATNRETSGKMFSIDRKFIWRWSWEMDQTPEPEEVPLRLSELFHHFHLTVGAGNLTLGDLRARLGEKGFGLLLLVLSLPSALPVPAPGYSTPFGLLLSLLGLQMICGKQPWLPARAQARPLRAKVWSKLFGVGAKWLARTERFIRPRLPAITSSIGHGFSGIFVLLMGLLMILPIPLTNTLPAIVIFCIGIGLSQQDGLFLLAAGVLAVFSSLVYGLVIYLFLTIGLSGAGELLDWLRERF